MTAKRDALLQLTIGAAKVQECQCCETDSNDSSAEVNGESDDVAGRVVVKIRCPDVWGVTHGIDECNRGRTFDAGLGE